MIIWSSTQEYVNIVTITGLAEPTNIIMEGGRGRAKGGDDRSVAVVAYRSANDNYCRKKKFCPLNIHGKTYII